MGVASYYGRGTAVIGFLRGGSRLSEKYTTLGEVTFQGGDRPEFMRGLLCFMCVLRGMLGGSNRWGVLSVISRL